MELVSIWNENPRFATPMVSLPHGEGIFVRDWVYFHHNDIGMTKGVILSFFKQVHLLRIL